MSDEGSGRGHYPYQAAIEAYGNGGFRFAGMSHRGSLLCLPSGMHAWRIGDAARLTLADFEPVLEQGEAIDVCLIGLDSDPALLDPAIRSGLRARAIIVEAVSTGSAIRTYNILLAEKRAVAAALVAVERVR